MPYPIFDFADIVDPNLCLALPPMTPTYLQFNLNLGTENCGSRASIRVNSIRFRSNTIGDHVFVIGISNEYLYSLYLFETLQTRLAGKAVRWFADSNESLKRKLERVYPLAT
jgi:hypothetical protein